MILQTLTSVIYDIVSNSWSFASITAKYYLLATVIYISVEKDLNLEIFREKILLDSRFVLTGFVIGGTILYLTSISVSPVFKLFSEFVALVYLGYLFWEY